MDSRSWPWKKKSSKTGILKALEATDPASSSLASVASLQDQGSKKVNYVQIPLDSYTHLTGLKDEIKNWQSQVKDLEQQLSAAKLEITAKENLATQHSKVAEEAVSGWEKADAEASALKNQLASVSLLKLTAEDRVSHLDGALKECLTQLRVAKEEHHEKMNEVIITKNKYCDKIKADLEVKITELEQKLVRSATEKAALSRSLQEHSSMLMKMNDEKSEVEGENELLKREIQSLEKEISSLKYEVHVVSEELDIRNEEKNMSLRSAEVANKQYLDSAKKIAKLEAECQRLRGLVKKKLPGPAALAQMKLEIENWSHDSGEHKPLGKNTKSKSPSLPDIHTNNASPDVNENELLMKRLLGTEEKMKMLRESLATRNMELQSSRDLCDKMIGKIRNLETQLQILNQRKNSPRSVLEGAPSASSPNSSDPQSVTFLFEDGFDDDGRCSESPTISDPSNIENDKIRRKSKKSVTGTSIDLMDDFLEMERIADTTGSSYKMNASVDASNNEVYSDLKGSEKSFEPNLNQFSSKLLSRIFLVLESQNKSVDLRKVLEAVVKNTMLDLGNTLVFNSSGSHTEKADFNDISTSQTWAEDTIETNISSPEHKKLAIDAQNVYLSDQDLVDTVSGISKFVMYLKSIKIPAQDSSTDEHGLTKEYEDLSASLDKFLSHEFSLVDLFLSLSRILVHIIDLKLITSPRSLELEVEHLKEEKHDMEKEMASLSQDLESKKLEFEELDSQLTEARSELESSCKWNGLVETQLKCMAESYKLLETRAHEQEANVKVLQEKKDSLEAMLEEEKCSHEEALARIKDLQDQIHRKDSCRACSSLAADYDVKSKKEREIANAEAKLAECQETIFLLGKQLKALHHPQTENESQYKEKLQTNETLAKTKLTQSFRSPQTKIYSRDLENTEIERASSFDMRVFDESPLHSYDSSSPSSGELSQRANKSFCSNSGLVSERSHNGSTRFFSPKGKH